MSHGKNKLRLLMTGGHAGGFASAVVDEINARSMGWEIHWIGPKYSVEGKKTLTLEARFFPKKNIAFHQIVAGKLQKKFTRFTIPALMRFPFGFIHALVLLLKIRPKMVLSFGGYASVPVVVVSWLLRIPIVVHEQIMGLGLANRMTVPFATKVAFARAEGAKFVSKEKVVVTGNPVRKSLLGVKKPSKLHNPPNIFIFTGSRASQIINAALKEVLPKMLHDYKIDHLVGDLDHEEFRKLARSLPRKLSANYSVHNFIDPDKVASYYERADIVVARGGANTVSELLIVKRPAILIPFPYIHFDEQTKNAKMAERFGIARVLPQKILTGETLISEIEATLRSWGDIVQKVKSKVPPDLHASEKLVDLLVAVLAR